MSCMQARGRRARAGKPAV